MGTSLKHCAETQSQELTSAEYPYSLDQKTRVEPGAPVFGRDFTKAYIISLPLPNGPVGGTPLQGK